MHQKLGPSCREVATPDLCLRDPIGWSLADGLTYRYVGHARHPGGVDAKMETALQALDAMYERPLGLVDGAVTSTRIPLRAEALAAINSVDLDDMFQRLATAAVHNDEAGMRAAARLYSATPLGMVMQAGDAAERMSRMFIERRMQPETPAEPLLGSERAEVLQPRAHHSAMGL